MVIGEVGMITEYRNKHNLHHESYCYLANVDGEIGEPHYTEKEIERECSVMWAKSISEAIQLLENDQPDNYAGAFIRARDLCFLKEALAIA